MTDARVTDGVRTLFLSDVHLGFRRARAAELAEFLRLVDTECIVLAGDIVDHLNMARRFFWEHEHTEVIRILLAKRRAGTRLIYIPGNHDSDLSIAAEILHGRVEVHRDWVHRTAEGRRLLVVHGDQFDGNVRQTCAPWQRWLGNALYDASVAFNDVLNDARRALGQSYWPLAEQLKLSLRASASYIERFEDAATRHAMEQGYDGVLCGHIHRATMRATGGTLYGNMGDWVESCSAIIESRSGELRLLRWTGSHARASGDRPNFDVAVGDAACASLHFLQTVQEARGHCRPDL